MALPVRPVGQCLVVPGRQQSAHVVDDGVVGPVAAEGALHGVVDLRGPYDEAYVARRWRVGLRHVEIGLPQVYTAAAL